MSDSRVHPAPTDLFILKGSQISSIRAQSYMFVCEFFFKTIPVLDFFFLPLLNNSLLRVKGRHRGAASEADKPAFGMKPLKTLDEHQEHFRGVTCFDTFNQLQTPSRFFFPGIY